MLMRSGEPPAPVTLPLLCALGRHKTDGLARWNAGYYFARCTRCRRDLVRTAFTRWQIPRGFRVVWQGDGFPAPVADMHRPAVAGQVEFPLRDEPPGELAGRAADDTPDLRERQVEIDSGDTAAAERADDMPDVDAVDTQDDDAAVDDAPDIASGAPSWFDRDHDLDHEVRFDANDRLADYRADEPVDARHADDVQEADDAGPVDDAELAGDAPEVVPETAPVEPPAPPASSKYPVVPDFMDEGPGGVGWDVVSGHIVPQRGTPDGHANDGPGDEQPNARKDVPTGLLSQNWQDLVRKRAQGAGEQGRQWLRSRRAAQPRPVPVPVPVVALTEVPPPPAERPLPPVAEDAPAPVSKPHITVSDAPAAPVTRIATATSAPRAVRANDLLMQYSPILAALVFGALVFAAAVVDGRNSQRVVRSDMSVIEPVRAGLTPPTTRSGAARPSSPAWVPLSSDVAYVTAGFLNCRAAPENDAEILRTIERGQSLRVLGNTPGWVDIIHGSQRCWVSRTLVSVTKPV